MAQTIKLKRSATSGAVPTTASLALGEMAINTYDGKAYIKKDNGTESVVEIGLGTSYSAGTGISLSGTTFSLTDTNAKLNLTGGTMTGALTLSGTTTFNNGRGDVYFENNINSNASGAGITLRASDNPTGDGSIFDVRSNGQALRLFVGQDITSSGYNPFFVGLNDTTTGQGTASNYAIELATNGNINTSGVITATGGNSTNWNTAYGWGNHAGNYLPLSGGTLTGKLGLGVAANTTNFLRIARQTGHPNIKSSDPYLLMDSNGSQVGLNWYTSDNVSLAAGGGAVHVGGTSPLERLHVNGNLRVDGALKISSTTVIDLSRNLTNIGTLNGGTAWRSNNDGSGSGLDADLLDGVHGSSFLRSDTTDTFSGALISTSRNNGIFGSYDSTKTDHIWSMGSAFKNDVSGANFGNLYGLAYKHTNNATGGTMGGGHQMVWCDNGTPRASIGYDRFWHAASGNLWGSSNDGSGSGLDADLLDGQQGSYYYPASNPNGYTSNVGDITGVTAGTGLTGGGTSGTPTLNVIGGDGITANADNITVDSTVIRTTGNQSMSGVKTFTGDTAWTDGNSFYVAGAGGGRVSLPAGASYFSSSGTHTGAVKIKLPTASKGKSDMISFEVTIFDYASDESVKLLINAYQYSTVNWNNQSVVTLASQTGKDYTVRFGSDATSHCLWIGETTSVWAHPQVSVSNFMCGFSANAANYVDGWDISYVTAFDTVQDFVTSSLPMAQYAQDADKLDGQQGSYYYAASNPNGYTSNVGDITGVTAGTGLTGGGTSGTPTLNVIGGSGITANANDITVDSTVIRTTGNQVMSGVKSFTTETRFGTTWVDPDAGIGRDAKFGQLGIAVNGGIKNVNGAYSTTSAANVFTTPSGYIELGPKNSSWAHIYTDRPNFYFNTNLYVLGSKVWHAGNDGSGSGLDADLLDGQQPSALSVNYANYAGYLPPVYAGGVQNNPQTYFSHTVGLKVAMTGYPNVWSDTLWINGYSGADVVNMCALHTIRNGQPRMWISSQSNRGTSYGTAYEFWSSYNDGSGSGLDADLLDGQQGSYYINTSSIGSQTVNNSNLLSGLALHTGRNNEVNKVVRTDVNGYIQAGWINTTSGVTTGTDRIYASNDGYVRYVTPTTFRNNLGLWWTGNDGSGSGLDADLLDGVQGSGYVNTTGTQTIGGAKTFSAGTIYMAGNLAHSGDTNTYMGFHAGDQWRVVTGGVERLEVNNTRVTVAGNLVAGSDITAGGRVYIQGSTTNFLGQGPFSATNLGINFGNALFFYSGTTQLVSFSTTSAWFNKRTVVQGGTTETAATPNIQSIAQGSGNGVTQYHVNFCNSGQTVHGRITSNNFSTTYATTSDYRVKEDVQEMEGATERLLQLNPVNFKWKGSEIRTDGFLAHEVDAIVPDAVVGVKDATEEVTDDEGVTTTIDSLQALDQAKLVPLLIKTIQELEARITALENA